MLEFGEVIILLSFKFLREILTNFFLIFLLLSWIYDLEVLRVLVIVRFGLMISFETGRDKGSSFGTGLGFRSVGGGHTVKVFNLWDQR